MVTKIVGSVEVLPEKALVRPMYATTEENLPSGSEQKAATPDPFVKAVLSDLSAKTNVTFAPEMGIPKKS